MAYLFLLAAIALGIAGTFCLKLSNGFTNPWPSALAFVFYGLMNVPFILADSSLDAQFLEKSHAAGLHALKGHRSV